MFRTCAKAALAVACLVTTANAVDLPTPQKITWMSAATACALDGFVYATAGARQTPQPVVVYQKNLNVARIGQEQDEPIIADLLADGCLVLVIDYMHHDKAKSPTINADSLALRKEMTGKKPTLLADRKIDGNHIFLLAEGFRLARNVTFAQDGQRTLRMDIAYPSHPSKPVPMLLEYTCDNVERMGSGSLLFCHDTLLDGAMAAGFAVAMADHPVAPPYKGLDDPTPDVWRRAKAAVRVARKFAGEHGLSERLGVIGFSRGGPFAAMVALNNGDSFMTSDDPHSADVQAALVHGNRYDYLDLLPNDPMLPRFKKAWGDPFEKASEWASHGAIAFMKDAKQVAPMFLNTSRTESAEYQDGLAKLAKRLGELGVEHVYQVDDDVRGHQVSTKPETVTAIYRFFAEHLEGNNP